MKDSASHKVVPFTPATAVEGVVEILEEALMRARAGELTSVAVCGATPKGETLRLFHIQEKQLVVLAALNLMEAATRGVIERNSIADPPLPPSG